MAYEAVIFDLDGTLVDSLEDLAASVNHALRKFSLPTHSAESYRRRVGNGAIQMVARALPADRQELLDEVLRVQQEYYQKHMCDQSKPYPGVIDMLNVLKGGSCRLAVLSNKPDGFTKALIRELFGANTFDEVWGHREEFPHKPDPASALALAKQLNILPEKITFVGDTAMDMETAQRAGMYAVGVSWGFRDRAELLASGAEVIINRPMELFRLVNR